MVSAMCRVPVQIKLTSTEPEALIGKNSFLLSLCVMTLFNRLRHPVLLRSLNRQASATP